MKRDMDLIRKMIFAIEECPHGYADKSINIEGYDGETLAYHAYLLMQAGLAKGAEITSMGSKGPEAMLSSLTWEGHEFADAARSETLWNSAKENIKTTAGAVSMAVLVEYLKYLGKQALGMTL